MEFKNGILEYIHEAITYVAIAISCLGQSGLLRTLLLRERLQEKHFMKKLKYEFYKSAGT